MHLNIYIEVYGHVRIESRSLSMYLQNLYTCSLQLKVATQNPRLNLKVYEQLKYPGVVILLQVLKNISYLPLILS